MLDLVIKGGRVVTPGGAGYWDIGVVGEKIVSVSVPGTLPQEAKKTIAATGKVVVPGGVEAHTHIGFPHLPSVSGTQTAGPEEMSIAALWGGTTTIMDFATAARPDGEDVNAVQAVQEHMANFEGHCYYDYSARCSYRGAGITSKSVGRVSCSFMGKVLLRVRVTVR